ncbi:MAG: FtsX-like permease family protein [Acidothermaceae bacterium]
MIRLGLRLTLAGGREALARLALIAVAVMVGVGLLLATVATLNAVQNQNARYAWLETGYQGSNAPAATSRSGTTTADPLWWRLRADYYRGDLIGRLDVAPTGPNSPIPPGIAKLPGPGQFYASPALGKLLRDTPAAELGDRYPGVEVGTIGAAALPAPNSLVVIIGDSAADLSQQDGARQVTSISTTKPDKCNGECAPGVGNNGNGLTLILSVVVAGLLFPVLIFIGAATRLSAARREQRFAAMRLVGATPRQVSVIATVESVVAAAAGVAAGFGLFYVLRVPLAAIQFTGDPFFTSDLSLSLANVLLIALGIPLAAAVAARLALRRVRISPLGVSRRVTPRPPRPRRLIPLLVGIVELGYFAYVRDIGARSHTSTNTEAVAYLIGVLLVMAGLVIAGPWLTLVASRVSARRATRPATLIAARRLADNPHASFRAISGLILAVFIATASIGIITTIVAYDGSSAPTTSSDGGLLVDSFGGPQPGSGNDVSISATTKTALTSIPGVTGVASIYDASGGIFQPDRPGSATSCAEIARIPALGHCQPGAATALISLPLGGGVVSHQIARHLRAWPDADLTTAQLQALPLDMVVVGTDGSTAAVESARTVLDLQFANDYAAQTISEIHTSDARLLDGYRQLANVIILTSLPIAGCSLAVSIAGGLAERKRPFSLLRLAGAPLAMLRRVILLEAAAPLAITAVVSAAAGFVAAQLFLRAQLAETLQPPGLQYYVVVAVGLLASLAVIASTLPLLRRISGPEAARNE